MTVLLSAETRGLLIPMTTDERRGVKNKAWPRPRATFISPHRFIRPMVKEGAPTALEGSERRPLRGSRASGKLDPEEEVRVTVVLRPRAPREELSLVKRLGAQLPRDRSYPTRASFEKAFGATRTELGRVREFASANSLKVLEASSVKRSVPLSGTVEQVCDAFQVSLSRYEHPRLGAYRGRTGHVYVPKELAPLVKAVL